MQFAALQVSNVVTALEQSQTALAQEQGEIRKQLEVATAAVVVLPSAADSSGAASRTPLAADTAEAVLTLERALGVLEDRIATLQSAHLSLAAQVRGVANEFSRALQWMVLLP
jgi:hypothetical protein